MGIFSRKGSIPRESPSANRSNDFIGRKFRSNLSIAECLENFSIVKDQCYRTTGGIYEIEWRMRLESADVESSQGGPPAIPPATFHANDLSGGGRIYLAIWDGMVYHDHSGVGGPPREMWFVPPGFDTSPIPIAGTWKMRDGSLSSIGYVESASWAQ